MTVESIITRLPLLSFVVDFKVFLPMRSKIKKNIRMYFHHPDDGYRRGYTDGIHEFHT